MKRQKYYLAVDLGASSGRHILAHMENGRIVLEEMYRFPNESVRINGHRAWDTEKLFREILTGMKKCAEAGKIPYSMGVDTWGVDYVLLDGQDRPAGICYAYRDSRTAGIDEKVFQLVSSRELYRRTGIQKASFNTIYQLMALKEQEPEVLAAAESFLMMPDYFHFLLTGIKKQEYTEATSTQLVSAETKTWDYELIAVLGLPGKLFGELSMPGTPVGKLRPDIREEVGYDLTVVLPATHDTGSAVMSVPSHGEDVLYISSGTWSLMGTELPAANTGEAAQSANFTNEGGYDYRFRFLKNIMGLWMIQSVRKELEAGCAFSGQACAEDYSFGTLMRRARAETISSLVNADDERFLAPASMIAEIRNACAEADMEVPVTPWQIARVIYRSLAECYRKTAVDMEAITGRSCEAIHIVGGGSNADWLNELTAAFTGKRVLAGPVEATAAGNAGAQMLADGVFADLAEFRSCVFRSFDVKEYLPRADSGPGA